MLTAKEIINFYRLKNLNSKLSALRPLGHLFFGYLIAFHFELQPIMLNTTAVVGVLVSSYALNDFFDWKIQKERNFLSDLIASGKIRKNFALLLSALPLLLSFLVFLTDSRVSIFLFLVGAVLSITYSIPPFRFKERGVIGLVISPITMVILFLQGYFLFGEGTLAVLILALILLLFQSQLEFLHTLEDSTVEKEVRKINNQVALKWLKTLPLLSIFVALIATFYYPLFFVSIVFSFLRFYSYKNFSLNEAAAARRNLLSLKLSLYEFGLYGFFATLGWFGN